MYRIFVRRQRQSQKWTTEQGTGLLQVSTSVRLQATGSSHCAGTSPLSAAMSECVLASDLQPARGEGFSSTNGLSASGSRKWVETIWLEVWHEQCRRERGWEILGRTGGKGQPTAGCTNLSRSAEDGLSQAAGKVQARPATAAHAANRLGSAIGNRLCWISCLPVRRQYGAPQAPQTQPSGYSRFSADLLQFLGFGDWHRRREDSQREKKTKIER